MNPLKQVRINLTSLTEVITNNLGSQMTPPVGQPLHELLGVILGLLEVAPVLRHRHLEAHRRRPLHSLNTHKDCFPVYHFYSRCV